MLAIQQKRIIKIPSRHNFFILSNVWFFVLTIFHKIIPIVWEWEKKMKQKNVKNQSSKMCVCVLERDCVCVCVCVRERVCVCLCVVRCISHKKWHRTRQENNRAETKTDSWRWTSHLITTLAIKITITSG